MRIDLDNPKVVRASAGQWFTMAVSPDLPTASKSVSRRECKYRNSPSAKLTYWEVDWRCPSLISAGE